MDLKDVFGVNVLQQFLAWYHGEYTTDVEGRHEGTGVTLVLLNTSDRLGSIDEWRAPLCNSLLVAHTGDKSVAELPDGTLENVGGKLRFYLRTGVRWLDDDPPVHLVEVGDFPREGAGDYRGFTGGLSGLPGGTFDWWDFKLCIDKLIELLTAVNSAAIDRANALRKQEGAPVGTKYLNGINVSDLFQDATTDEPASA